METKCISCETEIKDVANFCGKCGTQQKCKSCGQALEKENSFCDNCGQELIQPKSDNSDDKPLNTIKFNQTRDSRSYEINFTDNVGNSMGGIVKDMLSNQILTPKGLPSAQQPEDINENNVDESTEQITEETQGEVIEDTNTGKIRHIDDLERTLECSEKHWILVYAFYISEQGTKNFSRDAVRDKYKVKRDAGSRMSNFPVKWNELIDGLIETVRTGEFKLTSNGVKTALGIIKGTISSDTSKNIGSRKDIKQAGGQSKTEAPKKAAKTAAKSVEAEEFDLSKNSKKPSLSEFLTKYQIGESSTQRILAIAYYIRHHNKVDYFTEGNIEYAYVVLKLNKRIIHLYQTIVNIKNDNLWFEKNSSGKWKLTRAGDIYFDDNVAKGN